MEKVNQVFVRLLREKGNNKAKIAKDLGGIVTPQSIGYYERGRTIPVDFILKWKEVYGEDLLALAETDSTTKVSQGTSESGAAGSGDEISEDKYKDLIENNTLYLLVPKSILEEKYRLMPVAQIEKEAGMIATQNKTIEHLLDVQKALLKKIDELESQAKPVKVK